MITFNDADSTQLKADALTIVDEAKQLTIQSGDDAEAVGEFLRLKVKAIIAEANGTFDPMIASARSHTKLLRDKKEAIIAPLREAERRAKRLIADYHAEESRKRREAQAAAEREARERAEAEALERAAALEDDGHQAAAEAEIETPAPVAVVAPVVEAPKVTGVSVRHSWDYSIVDECAIDRKFMKPDAAKIGKTVRAMGPDASTIIGGVTVFEKTIVASKSQ